MLFLYGCGSASTSNPKVDASPPDSAGGHADASPPDSAGGLCGVCLYEWEPEVSRCPARAPTSIADLRAWCGDLLSSGAQVAFGPCSPADYLLEHCEPTVADPDDDVLSVSFGTHGSDCHYSHTTGQLIGTSTTSDTYTLCDNKSPLAASQGLKNPRCRAGAPAMTFDCTSLLPGRTDAGDDSNHEDAAVDASQPDAPNADAPDGL